QRLMEQSIAECTECDELEAVTARCRARYREMIDAIQQRFLEAIQKAGWPPDGVLRQTQVFDRFVTPALAAREKVAYFLTDALRFDMGRDLAGALSTLGEIDLQPVASTLPTITSVGMAALMPGADNALTMRALGDDLIPHLGERCLKTSADRMKLLAEKYGDRFVDAEISEFLSLPSVAKRKARLKNADLVVVRDSRIDRMGETITLREARKYMTDLLGDLKAAVTQLIHLGYGYVVVATDHGHVLLPEVLPGDVVPHSPAGEWPLKKRRSLLGQQIKEGKGTTVLSAAHVGIQGDATELVVPNGFGVYSRGSGYFHGGLSLQECVLPLITLRAKSHPAKQAGYELKIHYRSDTFTSWVIGLKVWFNSMFEKSIRVRIEAFDGSGPSAHKVGDAADCDARDEVTHEVTLTAGQDTSVPVLLDPDFDGDQVEIRATNPDAPVVWAQLTLKNGIMD
ncbi:MAG: PglZ domain-containing protein, partial [Chloroflexota bacterium]|nr:PglZ domain-containing protein [Chloroflexota bacterium]